MMKMKKWLALSLACVMMLGLMAGCGNDAQEPEAPVDPAPVDPAPVDPAPVDPAPADPVAAQELKYGIDTWPAGFDPHTISAVAAVRVFGQVYEPLIEMNEDMTFRGVIAESWEIPDDVTYIFHIRQGVKFHNGREVKADDVVFSFQRVLGTGETGVLEGALGNSKAYYAGIASIEATDEYTVKMVLAEPNAAFMSTLTSNYGAIVCKEVVLEHDNSLITVDTMVGTGPFKYESSTVDNNIVLVKNADYWIPDQPKLDKVTYYLMADEGARLAALQSGQINFTTLSAMNLESVQGDDSIKVSSYQSNNYTYLGFNLSMPEMQDIRVRQAMSLAVNRQEIIDYVYNGEATVSTFMAPAMGHWVWDAEKESELYTQNIEKAQQLMTEAGYSAENPLKINMAAGLLDSIRDTAVVLQQQLKQIYIEVEVNNLESSEYVDIWGKMDTPEAGYATMCGQNGSGTDPNRAVAFFYSSTGNANVWGYKNDRVDELCALGVGTPDEAEREGYYMEAQKIIVEECANLWFASPMEYFFVSSSVEGFQPYATSLNDLRNVTIG